MLQVLRLVREKDGTKKSDCDSRRREKVSSLVLIRGRRKEKQVQKVHSIDLNFTRERKV